MNDLTDERQKATEQMVAKHFAVTALKAAAEKGTEEIPDTLKMLPRFKRADGFKFKAWMTAEQVENNIDMFEAYLQRLVYGAITEDEELFFWSLADRQPDFWEQSGVAICYNQRTGHFMVVRMPLHTEYCTRQGNLRWSFYARSYGIDILNKLLSESQDGFFFQANSIKLQDAIEEFNGNTEEAWKILFVIGK